MTQTLAHCELVPIDGAAQPRETGAPIKAQFNPTSLKMQVTNEVRRPGGRGRQAEQYIGASSTTLSFELIFDTADEGTTGSPVNVRDRTQPVQRFLLPSAGNRQAPPRVRFKWGAFVYDGVVTSLTEDLDLFAANGVPLRAKLAVSVKEQRPEFAALQSGPGARTDSGAVRPVALPSGGGAVPPGAVPPPRPGAGGPGAAPPADRTAPALGGESVAEFAARQGLDPAAWRAVGAGIASPLALEGGRQIDFSTALTPAPGVGVSAGVEAGVGLSLEASLGLDARAAGAGAGFALAAAGGVQAALAIAANARATAAAGASRAAFGLAGPAPRALSAPSPSTPAAAPPAPVTPAGTAPAPSAREEPPGPAERRSTRPTDPRSGRPLEARPSQPAGSNPSRPAARRSAPPTVDPRAVSFGSGVPLRPRVHGAASERPSAGDAWVRVGARPAPPIDPVRDPATPPWAALPARDPGRRAADAEQGRRRPTRPCGCPGACRHGGGAR